MTEFQKTNKQVNKDFLGLIPCDGALCSCILEIIGPTYFKP